MGGQAIFVIVGVLAGPSWEQAAQVGGRPWTMLASFAFFWLIQMLLIWRGIEGLRRFENWAAPLVTVAFLALMIWIVAGLATSGRSSASPRSWAGARTSGWSSRRL